MTLQQLRYITTVADTGTITEAAKKLYISQPSLTNAIHELEKEMGLTIFNRTNKGIFISREGEEFLGYARQVLEQTTILEDKYKKNGGGKKQFCVSTQHYSFAVNVVPPTSTSRNVRRLTFFSGCSTSAGADTTAKSICPLFTASIA